MKKCIVLLLIGCMTVGVLNGCGKQKETQNTGVIINMGDNSTNTNKDLFDQSSISVAPDSNSNSGIEEQNKTDNTNNDSIAEIESKITKEEIFTLGSWVSGMDSMTLFENGSVSAYINGLNIAGTFETDYSTYITLKYTERTEIEDASETDVLLGNNFSTEDKELKMDIIKIETDTTINASVLTVKLDGKEIKMIKHAENISSAYEDSQSNKDDNADTNGHEMTPEEMEAFKQSLIEQGINPETGRTFEEDEKLREMGIDPLTGEPIVEETTTE